MGESEKIIWLPKSETTCIVQDGVVTVSDSMVMQPQPIKKPSTGFGK